MDEIAKDMEAAIQRVMGQYVGQALTPEVREQVTLQAQKVIDDFHALLLWGGPAPQLVINDEAPIDIKRPLVRLRVEDGRLIRDVEVRLNENQT